MCTKHVQLHVQDIQTPQTFFYEYKIVEKTVYLNILSITHRNSRHHDSHKKKYLKK